MISEHRHLERLSVRCFRSIPFGSSRDSSGWDPILEPKFRLGEMTNPKSKYRIGQPRHSSRGLPIQIFEFRFDFPPIFSQSGGSKEDPGSDPRIQGSDPRIQGSDPRIQGSDPRIQTFEKSLICLVIFGFVRRERTNTSLVITLSRQDA